VKREICISEEFTMTAIVSPNASEQAVETMIGLARLTKSHPIAIAGADSLQIHRELHRRGFFRCAVANSPGLHGGQYSAALIAGDRSQQAVEASLAVVSRLLGATATIVVSINSEEKDLGLKLRSRLEQLGFRIEAGVRCQYGFLLSAYRCNFVSVAKAA
jgi:hypothetical protein